MIVNKTGQNVLRIFINDILRDFGLNAEDIPLLVGEVVSSDQGGSWGSHNDVIQ